MLQTKTINKFQHFPFHLVDPSPWPILTSFSLSNLTIGGLLIVDLIKNLNNSVAKEIKIESDAFFNLKVFSVIFFLNFIILLFFTINFYLSYNLSDQIDFYVNEYIVKHGINKSIFLFTISLLSGPNNQKNNLKKIVTSPYNTLFKRPTSNNYNNSAKADLNTKHIGITKGENPNKTSKFKLTSVNENSTNLGVLYNIDEDTNLSIGKDKLPQQQKIEEKLNDNKNNIRVIDVIKYIKTEIVLGLKPSYPEHIEKLNNNYYFKFYRLIGAVCLFISLLTRRHDLSINLILFDLIRLIAISFILYNIVLFIYSLFNKQDVSWKSSNVLVENSFLKFIITNLRRVIRLIKFSSYITMTYGLSFSFIYVIDEILAQHNYARIFIPNLKLFIKSLGLEKAFIEFLIKMGLDIKKKSVPLEDTVSNNKTVLENKTVLDKAASANTNKVVDSSQNKSFFRRER